MGKSSPILGLLERHLPAKVVVETPPTEQEAPENI